ncbi:MAG: glutamine--fructose-6-phosphate transaminase (isomerizing) [Acidimicrobiia bacterium]|nr:glutamine--fructose-6-phosphate transaminase (isomerizing) [Acidimicrobiia bacterium]NNF63007.1 glutamine--fructose-6-phosphate transaminase (isomerizing) [Acidimicrobiia bacterium]
MCGIMGYVGPGDAAPVVVDGLRRLEYRGYDSAGIAVLSDGAIKVAKAAGKLARLEELLEIAPVSGSVGIGHTRWATHGPPNDLNAHPHTDPSGRFVVVHNGIIENFHELRTELTAAGQTFTSDTDTEILVHLVALEYDGDLADAVRKAVARARGAYALVVMTAEEPDKIVAVRKTSPMVIGIGENETFLASDIPAVLHRTRRFKLIEDGEMVIITQAGAVIETIDGDPVDRDELVVDWDPGQAERGGYDHFMLKEIHEQPNAISETLQGRLETDGDVVLDGVDLTDEFVDNLPAVWLTACGTAYHAALVGKRLLERTLAVPVMIEYAHELRYSDPRILPGSLMIAVSQSGETADTLAAARLAKQKGARLMAITNVVGSSLAREADDVLYTRAGPEIAVASTKAYLTQLIALHLLALHLGQRRGTVDLELAIQLESNLAELPTAAQRVLEMEEQVIESAQTLADNFDNGVDDVYFIGRDLDYAVATEGSLKLKEISYLHSEAMPAGELKHGTLALITEGMPVIVVLTQTHVYEKTLSALQEVKARGAHVTAVVYEDDELIAEFADVVLRIPRVADLIAPVLAIIPLQLLAYHSARILGHDIDQPRNLAKSVTVE